MTSSAEHNEHDALHRVQPLELATKDNWEPSTDVAQPKESWQQRLWKFANEQFLILGAIVAVAVAAAYPPLGRSEGPLVPSMTTGTVAVAIVFFVSGLTLRSSELKDAALYVKFNSYVQLFNLVFIPAVVFALAQLMLAGGFERELVDGLIIMACVPTTISMSVVMTKSAKGNESAAILNSSAGNLLGIVVTPLLLLLLVNEPSSVQIGRASCRERVCQYV